MKILKVLIFSSVLISSLFAFKVVPIKTGKPIYNNNSSKNHNSNKFEAVIKNNLTSNPEKNIKRTVNYEGQPIIVYAGYQEPLIVQFPAYIEKIEYMKNRGGIEVNQKEFRQGTQSLRIIRKKNSKLDNIIYVTILGKRIPVVVKYPTETHPPDHLVYVNIPKELLGINNGNSEAPLFTQPKVVKVTRYKNLSFKTNIKAVTMILRMIEGNAKDYYQKVNLNYKPPKENGLLSFFGSKTQTKEDYLALLFKKVFRGNKDFMTAYFNNEIIPQELYIDNFIVYLTNKRKAHLKVYGVKTKWCNLSQKFFKEITIDDIKLVFGKDILAAYHPFRKIPPGHCAEVYAVFYSLPKNKLPSY